MFRRLRAKLTFMYAGLFCFALLVIGAVAYFVIAGNTQKLAEQQLANTARVFSRVWDGRLDHLQDAASRTARAANLASAVTTRDDALIRAHLAELRSHSHADIAFVVTREGLIVTETGASSSVSPGLQLALTSGQPTPGVLREDGELYQGAAAALPGGHGWIVAGVRLASQQMDDLRSLSPIPVNASVLSRESQGWGTNDTPDFATLSTFIDQSLQDEHTRARQLRTRDGKSIALATRLPSLDGTLAVLLLRHSLSSGLSPYGALFNTLIVIGLAAVILLIAGTWFLARGITQPLSTLEAAARKLREGVYETVVVRTEDELSRLAESFNAMTGAIRERERRITQLAFHDGETRLPNRVALERKLNAAARPERLYLAAIGVDRFAHVRGAIGYTLAGELVRQLGGRLAHLAPNAPMARLSSDVLGVAFIATSEHDALKRADALIANLEQSVSLGEHVIDVHVTIGIAQPGGKDETSSAMIERASIALDQTRQRGQKAGMYDEAAYGDPARNLSLMGEMRRALESGAIYLAHQPKYNFRTGRIDSAESLVRWRHPTRGNIAPDIFVPMAEETGHIRALTEWVLERAIVDQKALKEAGHTITLAVNISARLLSDTDFAKRASALARQAPHQICFEITETAIIDNPIAALENIELFASSGVRIAIDDYGSGLSSLAYLKQLPAHELKIDKLFVQNVTSSQRDALLVRSTIDLAHGLGMNVTAEGVETPAAFALLASMNCDLAQGYLISRPASLEELIALLSDDRRLQFYKQTALGASPQLAPAPQQPKQA
ncbi:MAG: EAL domain-containing protein [Hyphomonadaceae bacterium]|nr:EAL domain-containing protein [Hyphomonadaceae bacterium]